MINFDYPKCCSLVMLIAALLLFSCERKFDAIGELDEIIVFADSSDWEYYEEALRSQFSKGLLMPAIEDEFLLRWRPADRLSDYKVRKNIFLLGRLDSNQKISAQIKNMVSKDQTIVDGINSGKFFYIPQNDPWAADQYVLFLVAPDRDELIQRIYDLGDLAVDNFKASYYSRLRKDMYGRYENHEMGKYIATHYPFTLRVQHDYQLVDESRDENYLWLRRVIQQTGIDRSMTIQWFPIADSIKINMDWIINKRNLLAAKLFEGDTVRQSETTMERVRFQRWNAIRLEGTWVNPKRVIGGPFRTITFVDRESKNIFIIDFYVQAIGQRKKKFLDQLDVMAHTFETKSYVKSD